MYSTYQESTDRWKARAILGDAKRKGSTDGEPETKRAKKPTVPENHVKVTKGKWGMKLFPNDFFVGSPKSKLQ